MGKTLRNLVMGVLATVATLLPMKANAQNLSQNFTNSKPLVGPTPSTVIATITKNGSTPIEVIGNPYNPWVAVDDTNTYNSYKEWVSKTTRDERIAYINQIVKDDSLDTKIDSLRNQVGWICGDIVNEMQLRIGQIPNEDEFVSTSPPSGGSFFKGNHKIRIPVYQFATEGVEVAHFVNGALVGDSTGNMDPTNFKAWYFWSNYFGWDKMNVKPGDSEMKDGPVSMGLMTYQKSVIDNKNFFSYIDGIVQWDLKNGVATLKHQDPYLIKEDPNKIKVHSGVLENIVVDAKKTKDLSPQNLESMGYRVVPDTSKENTNLPINISYFDSDTTWNDSHTSFSIDRTVYPWIYSGGVTKLDSTVYKVTLDNITAIDDKGNTLPDKFKVYQNYPNPFNPSTTIKYELSKPGDVKLIVYNVLGQEVYKSDEKGVSSGTHYFKDVDFSNLPSGPYFYNITANGKTETKKMMLLK